MDSISRECYRFPNFRIFCESREFRKERLMKPTAAYSKYYLKWKKKANYLLMKSNASQLQILKVKNNGSYLSIRSNFKFSAEKKAR